MPNASSTAVDWSTAENCWPVSAATELAEWLAISVSIIVHKAPDTLPKTITRSSVFISTMRVSHEEERGNGSRDASTPERALPHWLNPLVERWII
jgi:hypothetical protein